MNTFLNISKVCCTRKVKSRSFVRLFNTMKLTL